MTTVAGLKPFADGPALQAHLNRPSGIAVAPDCTVYFADRDNHRIRVIKDGNVHTVAGCGVKGFADGPALQAMLASPHDVALAPDGSIYISDFHNNRVRVLRDGQLCTVAGGDQSGFADGSALLKARFRGPNGLAVAPDGSIYISRIAETI